MTSVWAMSASMYTEGVLEISLELCSDASEAIWFAGQNCAASLVVCKTRSKINTGGFSTNM